MRRLCVGRTEETALRCEGLERSMATVRTGRRSNPN